MNTFGLGVPVYRFDLYVPLEQETVRHGGFVGGKKTNRPSKELLAILLKDDETLLEFLKSNITKLDQGIYR